MPSVSESTDWVNMTKSFVTESYKRDILNALNSNNLDRLREISYTKEGLIDSQIRSRAWSLLIPSVTHYPDEKVAKHKDEEQVFKDISRSFVSFPINVSSEELERLRTRLQNLIFRVLRCVPELNYYQGYHDVASTIILVFENDHEAFKFLYCLSLSYLRDHMLPNIESSLKQLDLIPELMSAVDKEYWKLIYNVEPVYALSCVISIYSHDISSFKELCLIWDFIFLENDPSFVLYIYIGLLVYYKDDVINDLDEISGKSFSSDDTVLEKIGDVEFYDRELVHIILNNLIKDHLNSTSIDYNLEIYNVLKLSLKFKKAFKLKHLKTFKKISKFSALKNHSVSLTILNLQIFEQMKILKKQKKLEIRNKQRKNNKHSKLSIINHIVNPSMFLKVSLSVGLIGIILRSSATGILTQNFIGIHPQFSHVKNVFTGFWDSIVEGFDN